MVKLGLDGGQIWKDVGVVEFQVIEYCGVWLVVYEFIVFVEKGGVVFVCFDYEKWCVVELCGNVEVVGYVIDQIVGVQFCVFQNLGQYGGGGGFVVGICYCQYLVFGQYYFGEQLGVGGIGQVLVEYMFYCWVVLVQGVVDYYQIWGWCQLGWVVVLDQFNVGGVELIVYWWVNVLVGIGDLVFLGLDQLCQ